MDNGNIPELLRTSTTGYIVELTLKTGERDLLHMTLIVLENKASKHDAAASGITANQVLYCHPYVFPSRSINLASS